MVKNTSRKVVYNKISDKKLSGRVSLCVELEDAKSLPFFNLGMESRFTLGLNAAKNNDYIGKSFKQKFCKITSPTKSSVDAHFYLSQELS